MPNVFGYLYMLFLLVTAIGVIAYVGGSMVYEVQVAEQRGDIDDIEVEQVGEDRTVVTVRTGVADLSGAAVKLTNESRTELASAPIENASGPVTFTTGTLPPDRYFVALIEPDGTVVGAIAFDLERHWRFNP